jgi:hypothetical protein
LVSAVPSSPSLFFLELIVLIYPGGGSEEIMSELAIREEAKDLRKYASASSKL